MAGGGECPWQRYAAFVTGTGPDDMLRDSPPEFLVIYEHTPADMGLLRCVLLHNGCRVKEHRRYDLPEPDIIIEKYMGVASLGGKGRRTDHHELAWLKDAINSKQTAVLGVCQGVQNVAEVVSGGGPVEARPPHRGLFPLHLRGRATTDRVLKHLPDGQGMCQWHGYTFVLPAGAESLAYTGTEEAEQADEAFRLGDRVYGFQFHPEVPSRQIPTWVRKRPKPQTAECDQIARVGWKLLDAWVKMALDMRCYTRTGAPAPFHRCEHCETLLPII